MDVLQAEGPVEAGTKKNDNGPKENSAIIKPKSEEPEVQTSKKSKEEKARKKDDKSVEQVLKALHALGTNEEKLAAMCKKYSDTVDENRKLQLQVKQCEKRCQVLQREKDQLQSEQSKTILTKSRLENLCRELQKQNKAIKEESLLKINEEEEKRKVVSAKFQTALGEVTALMQQNNENYSALKEENLEMQNKFKTLCEQYELREQQVKKMTKQLQLASELADVKLAKVKIDMFAERELLANEKEQLLVELTAYQNKCQEMQKTEAALRSQVVVYAEKYDEFQNALAKSNQIYSGFKSEIEKMSKKITRLEKETSVWKMKWEGSHKALLQMAADKQQRDAELTLAAKQVNQLQKLCRTLQADRSSLIVQLKNEGHVPKIGAGNEESAPAENVTKDGANAECQSQTTSGAAPEVTADQNADVKDSKSDCSAKSNKLDDKSINEIKKDGESSSVGKTVEEPEIENSNSVTNSIENNELVNELTNNEQSSVGGRNELNNKKSELKCGSNCSVTVKTASGNDKKDQNCIKSTEPKKGKDGSKKRKK